MNKLSEIYNSTPIGNAETELIWNHNDKSEVYDFCKHRLSNTADKGEQVRLSFLLAGSCRELHLYEESLKYTEIAFSDPALAERKRKFVQVVLNRLITLCHTHIATGKWHLQFRGIEIGALETFRVLDKFFHGYPDVSHIRNRLKSLGVIKEDTTPLLNIDPVDVCVVTSYDDKYAPIGDICAKTLSRYCRTHGYIGKIIRNFASGRHPMWDKIAIIQNLLSEGIPYVFWVDADSMFVRYDRRISDEIDDTHNLYLTSGWAAFHTGPGDMMFRESANSGIMLVKNTEWSKKFMSDVWNQNEFIDSSIADNAAMLHLLGYNSFMGLSDRNNPDLDLIEKIKFLDFNWNSHPIGCMGNDPIIMHYAGINSSERVKDMMLR